MVREYTANHDQTKAASVSAPTSSPSPASAARGAEASPLFPLAIRRLPPELADNARILAEYARALRGIADHPALAADQKQARLQALAAAIRGESPPGSIDEAVRAALNLSHLLESRGFDFQDPWQMLQAAGLDIAKSAYPDWSDLVAWCRYWAAPMGRMALRLAGGPETAVAKAESFAMGAQILLLVEQAATHRRWLGRVYLPERWFRDAGCTPEELAKPEVSAALKQVFARALAEARRLIDVSDGVESTLSTRKARIAAATARAEALAWAAALGRGDLIAGVQGPGFAVRIGIGMSGFVHGMRA